MGQAKLMLDKIMMAVGIIALAGFASLCIIGVMDTVARVWKSTEEK